MRFNIKNLGFKLYCYYSDNELAKSYVVYAIECERELKTQEWNILLNAALKFTLRKNRIYISRRWKQGNIIYFTGKQSHGCGYSWDEEILTAFSPLLNPLED